MKCAVYNCDNDNKKNYKTLSFFRFPDEPELLKQWLKFCRMKEPIRKGAVVCMAHFKNEDIEGSLKYDLGYSTRRHLKPGVVPSVIERYKDEKTLLREKRAEKRNNKKIVDTLLKQAELANPLNEKPIENLEEILELKPSKETNPLEGQLFDISLLPTQFSIQTKQVDGEPELLLIEDHFELSDDHIKLIKIKDCKEYNLDSIESKVKVKTLEKEIELLKKENENLKNQLKRKEYLHKNEKEKMQRCLDRAKFEHANIETKLATIFTKGQIQKLKNGPQKQFWSEEDIAHSMSIYTNSGRAYQALLNNNYPLPSIRTLQNWARKSYLAQRKGNTSNSNSTTTATNENDEPIYEELSDEGNINEMIQKILEDDNNANVENEMIEESMDSVEFEEGLLLDNDDVDDDIEILDDNEIETIEIEVFSDMEVENMYYVD